MASNPRWQRRRDLGYGEQKGDKAGSAAAAMKRYPRRLRREAVWSSGGGKLEFAARRQRRQISRQFGFAAAASGGSRQAGCGGGSGGSGRGDGGDKRSWQ
ncbi:hypothetical protein NL676_006585 [Syzygium grande]|nr:hypothetical protein NL676_006585 [Syzygium grande]